MVIDDEDADVEGWGPFFDFIIQFGRILPESDWFEMPIWLCVPIFL